MTNAGLGYGLLKRVLDVTGAGVGLAVAAPLMAGVSLGIVRQMGRPVFFRQERPGRLGVPFTLLKFRTMSDKRDCAGNLLPDDARITSVGRFLRRTSLDELPTLINVLRGEMSLVGPRPLLMRYLLRYNADQARRHTVNPGVTGWTQVNGRNALGWDEKFALDVWYVENRSLRLDLRILAKTVGAVLRRDGVSHAASATMPEFMGKVGNGRT